MSTRCQIGFYEQEEKDLNKFEALIYRHSDGYPDGEHGVLAAIMPFLHWWQKGRGVMDFEYCSARLLQYLCNKYDGYSKAIGETMSEAGAIFSPEKIEEFTGTLGHGISNAFHGDIEYLYAVRPNRVEVYKVGYEGDDINKKAELVQVDHLLVKSPITI